MCLVLCFLFPITGSLSSSYGFSLNLFKLIIFIVIFKLFNKKTFSYLKFYKNILKDSYTWEGNKIFASNYIKPTL